MEILRRKIIPGTEGIEALLVTDGKGRYAILSSDRLTGEEDVDFITKSLSDAERIFADIVQPYDEYEHFLSEGV